MNLSKLKSYAPQARRDFIQAMTDRAAFLGLTATKTEPVTVRGDVAVIAGREHPRSIADKRQRLEERIGRDGFKQTMEALAYTWFNRFVAIRFMELHGYLDHGLRVLSHPAGKPTPEILEKAQHVDLPGLKKDVVIDLKLAGDKDQELYGRLVVAQCNALHQAMPFLFERIGDETELLLPDNLINTDSLIRKLVAAIDEDDWKEVEIFGWLYQFYISEKKEEVFAGLKKKQKITPENIPAATQLFTPHWIVRYLVENSLGRLWLLNYPDLKLADKMPYYIEPVEPETDFIRISSPEEIRICDPACGSGHMLSYAFDLLYAIYAEVGYDAAEIPGLILTKNLYGIEIDKRAGALAAFALTMKAAGRRKRFLQQPGRDGAQPNICVLENVDFKDDELVGYVKEVGGNLFTTDLRETLEQFREAKTFGSLIVPKLKDVAELRRLLAEKRFETNLFLRDVHERVQAVIRMALYLDPKYHVVVANPPYMGGKGMNPRLGDWLKLHYPNSKTDLMTCFMERAAELCLPSGMWGMINLPSWLFLSSFENCRGWLLDHQAIRSLLQLGRGIFGSDFGSVAFTICNRVPTPNETAIYRRLFDKHVDVRPIEEIERLFLQTNTRRYRFQQSNFKKIPTSPIAYWISSATLLAFEKYPSLSKFANPRQGMATTNNDIFLRHWHEVSHARSAFGLSPDEARVSRAKWFPLNKGGEFHRWYGNNYFVVNYENGGKEMCEYIDNTPGVRVKSSGRVINRDMYFHEGLTWSTVTSGEFSLRYSPQGSVFETKGAMLFPHERGNTFALLGLFNTKIVSHLLSAISPTLDFHEGPMGRVPVRYDSTSMNSTTNRLGQEAVKISKFDWDAYETSWDFSAFPLLSVNTPAPTVQETYERVRAHWRQQALKLQRLEEENNRIFIDAYGLLDELIPEVPLREVTLACNPAHRYGGPKAEAELEALLVTDTMREFVSYAVGCMFGRYSLDEPGLILSNQGDGIAEYRAKVSKPKFAPNGDNIIPLLDRDWVDGDATTRFHTFLRITFGDERFEENLAFVEAAIGKEVRKFFLRDFFVDHLKRYKKRPIYWLFSSGPERAFQALVYLHRYDESTLARMRTEYVLPLQGRMAARIDQIEADKAKATSTSLRKKLQKEQDDLKRQKEELRTFEERLRHLADQRIVLDLDDGVKANYAKFGDLLAESRAIVGAEDDE